MTDMTIEQILNMNKVSSNDDKIPEGFPSEPPKVGDFKGATEGEYKEYMKHKFAREQWENSLLAYRMREKEGDEAGMKRVIDSLLNAQKVAAMNESTAIDPNSNEAKQLDEMFDDESSNSSEEKDPNKNLRHLEPDGGSASKKRKADAPKIKRKQVSRESSEDDEKPKKTKIKVNVGVESTEYRIKYMNKKKRHIIFIPIQLIILFFNIIMTSVGHYAAAIVLGVLFAIPLGIFACWIVYTRRGDALKLHLVSFIGLEALSIILALIGGFVGGVNRNHYFGLYLGIPSILILIGASILAWFKILNIPPPIGKDNIKQTA